jgi:cytochrome c oxidase subunit II
MHVLLPSDEPSTVTNVRTSRAAPILLVALLVGCLPESATAEGERVSQLYALFMVAAALVFTVVSGLIGWSVLRHRAAGDISLPPQTRANTLLELAWWGLPTLLVLVLVVATTGVLARIDAPPPDDALVVEVDGFQWGWRFTYQEAGVTVAGNATNPPRVRLPLDRPIVFVLLSGDVVHSFYVPHFLVKRDSVPGQENRLTVTIEEEGLYSGQCGEFCGLLHFGMGFAIDAVPQADFEAWLAEQGPGG